MSDRLFVYGTLMPGASAWRILEPFATEIGPARVPGTLYDTGAGYPAAVFPPDAATLVHGVVVGVEGGEPTWRRLDRYEGTAYRRIVVATPHGDAATYEWIAARHSLRPIESGRWGETPA